MGQGGVRVFPAGTMGQARRTPLGMSSGESSPGTVPKASHGGGRMASGGQQAPGVATLSPMGTWRDRARSSSDPGHVSVGQGRGLSAPWFCSQDFHPHLPGVPRAGEGAGYAGQQGQPLGRNPPPTPRTGLEACGTSSVSLGHGFCSPSLSFHSCKME